MSLISDALKTAQREKKTGRVPSGQESPALLEGFFPYVSSSPRPARSRIVPIVLLSSLAVVVFAVVGWLVLPKFTGTQQPEQQVQRPIILPPRVSEVAVARDSARSEAPRTAPSVAADPEVSTGSETRDVALDRRTAPPTNRVPVRSSARAPESRPTTPVATIRDEPRVTSPVERAADVPARADYEAQATALFNAGDLPGARERFALATRFSPTARAWTNYGVTLQRLGDIAGANAAYQSAIGIDANYLEAWLYQGRLAVQLGEVARAIPMFQRARAINPRNSDVNVELARLEAEAKNWTEARRFAEEAVRSDPANPRAHWYYAVAADQLKDFESAAREYAAYLQTVGTAEREQAQFVGWARTRLAELKGRP